MLMNRVEIALVNSPPLRWLQRYYEVLWMRCFGGPLPPGPATESRPHSYRRLGEPVSPQPTGDRATPSHMPAPCETRPDDGRAGTGFGIHDDGVLVSGSVTGTWFLL